MPIIVGLYVMMLNLRCHYKLSEKVVLTLSKVSVLKTGKAKVIRCSTLESICKVLDSQPGNILEFVKD